MAPLLVKEKEIVTPGEILAEGLDYLPGPFTYREKNKILSKVVGLVLLSGRVLKITPLVGPYLPKTGDKIIGQVIDITLTGWKISTNTAYPAMLNIKDATSRYIKKDEDLSKILAIGEYIVAKIIKVTSQNLIDLSLKGPGLHKLLGGRIIKINPQKVPRIIGKQGSMISLIKKKTKCEVILGQNGLVWIKGTPEGEYLTEQAIKLIEEKSHQNNLTIRIEEFIEKNLRKQNKK